MRRGGGIYCRATGFLDHANAASVRNGAGGGIGFVNLFGAVGGFLAPIIRVKAETLFASGAAGLLTLAGVAIAGALIILTLNVRQAVSHSNSVHS
jgi:hypothetical protein